MNNLKPEEVNREIKKLDGKEKLKKKQHHKPEYKRKITLEVYKLIL